MLIGRVVGECGVGAELLQSSLALGSGAVGIDHAANRDEIARLEL